jgi:hypothetical protein
MNKAINSTFLAIAFFWIRRDWILSEDYKDYLFTKQHTYATLSPLQRKLFDDFVEEIFPNGLTVQDILNQKASVRNKTRLAEAFFRNQNNDILMRSI